MKNGAGVKRRSIMGNEQGDMKKWLTSMGGLMFVLAIARQYSHDFKFLSSIIAFCFPQPLLRHFQLYKNRLTTFFYPYIHISIDEFSRSQINRCEAYSAVEAYLSGFASESAKRLKAEMENDSNKLLITMGEQEKVSDSYRGVEVWWQARRIGTLKQVPLTSYNPELERRSYVLTFHKQHRKMIVESYLEQVMKKGKEIKTSIRVRKHYTNNSIDHSGTSYSSWSHIVFEHPATFDTIAMDPMKKQEIIEDLLTFKEGKDFYARIGKAWKRGYLLYGPPGTGKSTLIAAMANMMEYDVYDLELTAVKDNNQLRRLLIDTKSKSIIVIEDIDCSLDVTGKRRSNMEKPSEGKSTGTGSSKLTLSGLLNAIDGLWSASGGERIIVFTANYVEKLDPALTRRGRMDKHIELSYCSFEGFKMLAKNYLQIETHPMFEEIEKLMKVTNITPADVAENLMPKSKVIEAETCLSNLVQALKK